MRLLLDTHIALWAVEDDVRLPAAARRLIEDSSNDIHVSAVSVWEIAIKHGLAQSRDSIRLPPERAIEAFGIAGYRLVSITPEHAAAVGRLPALHSDPFDRLLIAQALELPMRLVTVDAQVAAYSDIVLKV